jgi:hypothetical protein
MKIDQECQYYKCPFCGTMGLSYMAAHEPWWDEQYICNLCHSTYNTYDPVILKLLDDNPVGEVGGE